MDTRTIRSLVRIAFDEHTPLSANDWVCRLCALLRLAGLPHLADAAEDEGEAHGMSCSDLVIP